MTHTEIQHESRFHQNLGEKGTRNLVDPLFPNNEYEEESQQLNKIWY